VRLHVKAFQDAAPPGAASKDPDPADENVPPSGEAAKMRYVHLFAGLLSDG